MSEPCAWRVVCANGSVAFDPDEQRFAVYVEKAVAEKKAAEWGPVFTGSAPYRVEPCYPGSVVAWLAAERDELRRERDEAFPSIRREAGFWRERAEHAEAEAARLQKIAQAAERFIDSLVLEDAFEGEQYDIDDLENLKTVVAAYQSEGAPDAQ